MRRLHHPSIFKHDNHDGTSAFWEAVRDQIKEELGAEPFSQLPVGHPCFNYLFSQQDSQRFELHGNDRSYKPKRPIQLHARELLPNEAGPVELRVAGLMLDRTPEMGVLIGGMGCGKTTTLSYVSRQVATSGVTCHFVNFNKIALGPYGTEAAEELLLRQLDPLVTDLLDASEEFGPCWDWAISHYHARDGSGEHGAANVLEPAINRLRSPVSPGWRIATTAADLQARAALRETVCNNVAHTMQYLALRMDYLLTERFGNERQRLCIVLDNVDPLPPAVQRELLMCAAQFQESANCKMLMAMRPLTYSLTQEQRATRTVKVIQHIGPPSITLIVDRIARLVEGAHLDDFRAPGPKGTAREMDAQEIRAWARQLATDLRDAPAAGGGPHASSASEFLDGMSNLSLRSALLLADKIFGSEYLLSLGSDDSGDIGGRHLKSHDIIRAILLGRHCHFQADLSRVTDNLFDLGDATAAHSMTCKYRVLRELSRAPGKGILHLDDILARVRPFGYDDRTLIEAINGLISQTKRLAWSDKVVMYDSLEEPAGSRLCISKAGNFYVDRAVHSLEYVQEVHVDVLLPDDVGPARYDHSRFNERFGSLYEFIRHLHAEDMKEVRLALTNGLSPTRYRETYGRALFSSEMARSLSKQVQNIQNSRLRRLDGSATRHDTAEVIGRWSSLEHVLAREDEAVLSALDP